MRLLKFLGFACLLIAISLTVMLVMGSRLPRNHVASASVVLPASPAHIWSLLEDTTNQPRWRQGLVAVRPLPRQDGHLCWLEVEQFSSLPMCEVLAAAPTRRIVHISDPELPFGGTWTYQLAPSGPNATNLTITENGTTGPALWRFLGHYLFHEDTMIKQYEASLKQAIATP